MQAISEAAEGENRNLTAEESQQYQERQEAFDSLSERIERMEREAGLAPQMTRDVAVPERDPEAVERTAGGREERGTDGWFVRADGTRTALPAGPSYRGAFEALVRNGGQIHMLPNEQRVALNVGTDAQGGFLVPDEFHRSLQESAREFGVLRQLATIVTTGDNGDLLIPKVSTNSSAVWLAEGAAFTESDATFAQVVLKAYKAGIIAKASDEMVQDSAFDVLNFLGRQAGQALAILTNTAYVNGASAATDRPEGVVNKATVGVTGATGQTTTVTADDLLDLFHSVIDPYRSNGAWLLRDATAKAIRKLKDADGQYLWQPGLQAGQPDSLLGRPVRIDPDVPAMAANAKSIVFGDLRGYWIRDVSTITVKPLFELYAANGQVALRTHLRTDGDLVDTSAVKVYQNSAT